MLIDSIDNEILSIIDKDQSKETIDHEYEIYKVVDLKGILSKMNNEIKRRELSFRIFKMKELDILKVRRPYIENSDLLAIYFTSEGDRILKEYKELFE